MVKATTAPLPAEAAPGHNFDLSKEDLAEIESLTREIVTLEDERSAINDDIAAAKSKIKAKGIDMDAWRAAKRRQAMDPDDRRNFDRSQAMCNAALGVPVQGSLFGDDDGNEAGGIPATLN